jgi:hypothetical protein
VVLLVFDGLLIPNTVAGPDYIIGGPKYKSEGHEYITGGPECILVYPPN